MKVGILGAPRPIPGRAVPVVAGGLVVAVALPIFLAAGWRLSGWAIAAALWAGVQGLALLLARLRQPGSGLLAFGMLFRVLAVMVVLVAVAASNAHTALAAAAVYALAYTAELGLSVAGYYGQEPRL